MKDMNFYKENTEITKEKNRVKKEIGCPLKLS
jgi:hypothetical protein